MLTCFIAATLSLENVLTPHVQILAEDLPRNGMHMIYNFIEVDQWGLGCHVFKGCSVVYSFRIAS